MFNKSKTPPRKSNRPQRFNPDREYIRKAVEDYIANGGEITYLGEQDLCDLDEFDEETADYASVRIRLQSILPSVIDRL